MKIPFKYHSNMEELPFIPKESKLSNLESKLNISGIFFFQFKASKQTFFCLVVVVEYTIFVCLLSLTTL